MYMLNLVKLTSIFSHVIIAQTFNDATLTTLMDRTFMNHDVPTTCSVLIKAKFRFVTTSTANSIWYFPSRHHNTAVITFDIVKLLIVAPFFCVKFVKNPITDT